MKYCLPYIVGSQYVEKADEVILEYNMEKILNFIKNVSERQSLTNGTIIIKATQKDLLKSDNTQVFTALKNDYNLDVKLLIAGDYNDNIETYIEKCRHLGIPFFFETYVRDWDTFHGLISIGVSDVYIVEEMGFSLSKLGQIAHASSVSIRAFANVAQSKWSQERGVKSFFIRPEDIGLYAPYVDVIEFYGDDNRQEVSYKAYAEDGKWFGDLRELIIGLDTELDSRFIVPMFAEARLDCEKKCQKLRPCNICTRIVDNSKVLEANGFIVRHDK